MHKFKQIKKPLNFFIFFLIISQSSWAIKCPTKEIGRLDHQLIDEASGMSSSQTHENILYHINDSGGDNALYITNKNGSQTRKLLLTDTPSFDTEAMSLGPCPESTNCIFIGDIGDNFEIRKSIKIYYFTEPKNIDSTITNIKTLELNYPDKAHDAEAMSINKNGDIYILTKERSFLLHKPRTANLFKISKSEWQNPNNSVKSLTKIAELDLPIIAKNAKKGGKVVTDISISPDQSKILVLTYENAFEFKIDANVFLKPTSELISGKDYREIKLKVLDQQEAITYSQDGKSFFYSTENKKADSPIMEVTCPEF